MLGLSPNGLVPLGLSNSASVSPPTGAATQDAVDGQSIRFHGTTTGSPTGMYTLTGSNGGVTAGPTSFTITANDFDFTVTGLHAGDYAPTLTVTNAGGAVAVTGTSSFSIIGVDGGGDIGDGGSGSGSSYIGYFINLIRRRRR